MKIILLALLLSAIPLNCLNCRIQPTPQQTTGLDKNERLSSGKGTSEQIPGLSDLNRMQKTNEQSGQQTKTEEQTETQRTQSLTDNFITPINKLNTLSQKAKKIDTDLKKNIQARRKKNRNASVKDLEAAAQKKKVTTYTGIFTATKVILARSQYLPTKTELEQPLYRNAAHKLGNVIQTLIKNVCEQPKKTNKMNIKQEYQKTIQHNDFLDMIANAANFSRGFSTQQNNDIKRTLTMLAQSKIPTISK